MSKLRLNTPSLSIIIPSYNQSEYLEQTLLSIKEQNYPDIELIVIDGGSTDRSVELIKRYSDYISYWVSEPDEGQVDAINKGLKRATGEWVAWQNSDDIYLPGAFSSFVEKLVACPRADVITGNISLIDSTGHVIREVHYIKPTYNGLRSEGMVVANQAAFWRRALHDKIGYLDIQYCCSFDYEWFLRLTQKYKVCHIHGTLGALRQHGEAKSSKLTSVFAEENRKILRGREPGAVMIRFYQLRRLLFLVARGDFKYVVQGLMNRFFRALKI